MPEISKPILAITPDMREFFDGARAGRLMVQKCDNCGDWFADFGHRSWAYI